MNFEIPPVSFLSFVCHLLSLHHPLVFPIHTMSSSPLPFADGSNKKRSDAPTLAVEPSKKKAKAAVSSLAESVPKDPMTIISELRYIRSLPCWNERKAAEQLRPEWYEFKTKWALGTVTVRKRINALLADNPTLTKKALLEATGIATTGQISKFLNTKGPRRSNVMTSAENHLGDLVNILNHMSESSTKRTRRLQCQLKGGLDKWDAEKIARFRAAFPDIEVSYGKAWWQITP